MMLSNDKAPTKEGTTIITELKNCSMINDYRKPRHTSSPNSNQTVISSKVT